MTYLTKDEVVKMAREAGLWVDGFPTDHIERFAALCRADLVAENAALKEQLKALGVYNESTKVKLARGQAVAEWQGSADGGKSWRRIDKPRGESIESRVAHLRNMTNSQGRPIYLIRALYTAPQSTCPLIRQMAIALNNAEDALTNSQSILSVLKQNGFVDAAKAANAIALGYVTPAIAAGQQYLKENGK